MSIPDVAAGDFDCPNFQNFLVYTYVYLTLDAAFGTTMLRAFHSPSPSAP